MQWKPVEGRKQTLTAIGIRGIYTLTKGGGAWWLQGVGHDELSIWELGVRGKPFTYQEQARMEAARIDSAKVREPAIGGE